MAINLNELGINRALFVAGLGDHRPDVLKSHVDAASTMENAGVRADLEVVGWRSGTVQEKKRNLRVAISAMGSRGAAYVSSGGGALTALLAAEDPALFEDKRVVLLSSRVRKTQPFDEVSEKSPLLAAVVEELDERWDEVPFEIQSHFLTTSPRNGENTVPKEALHLKNALTDVFPYDAVDHLDGINYMLTPIEREGEDRDGLERTIFLAQRVLVAA